MAKNDRTLLGEIERDVLDEQIALSAVLRKCVVLGGQAGSTALREWATHELRGYTRNDELPEYRRIVAPILIDAVAGYNKVTGQRISASQLPEGVREHIDETIPLNQSISEIEVAIKRSNESSNGLARFSLPMGADVASMMNYSIQDDTYHILEVYWGVSTVSLYGVVDQVRTTLAQLVAELRAGMSPDQELPSPELTTQAVNVAVHGHRAHVVVSTSQAGNGGRSEVRTDDDAAIPSHRSFWTRRRRVGAFIVGVATVVGTLAAILQLLR